jgi:hypothetical protein
VWRERKTRVKGASPDFRPRASAAGGLRGRPYVLRKKHPEGVDYVRGRASCVSRWWWCDGGGRGVGGGGERGGGRASAKGGGRLGTVGHAEALSV